VLADRFSGGFFPGGGGGVGVARLPITPYKIIVVLEELGCYKN